MAVHPETRIPDSSDEGVTLDIIVVGGGIAGLAAAVALSKIGHNVTVLEKSRFKREAGFMITLGPGACNVLKAIGFDFVKARAVDTNHVARLDGRTLQYKNRIATQDHTARTGGELVRTFYRPDLHNELKRLALLNVGSGEKGAKSPTLMLGCKVVGVDIDAGTVTLEDGRILKGDLIIGADGETSLVKAAFKEKPSLRQSPFKIFRAIVPTEKVLEDDIGRELKKLSQNTFAMFQDGTNIVSWFEGRDGLLQDLEGGYLIKGPEKGERDPVKAKGNMLSKFKDFHPSLLHVMQKAERVTDWEVYNSLPLPHLFKARALLIGDAAHSMMPTTGQGGTQSIEDTGALMVMLHPSALSSKSLPALQERLKVFENLRKGRLAVIMSLSGLPFGVEQELREMLPRHAINRTDIKTGEEHLEFLYSYNILEEAKKALEKSETTRAML